MRYRPDGPPALDRVSLDLPPGRRVALVGANGAGKSTVAAVLLRFCELSAGAALLNGHDLASYAADDVRSVIGGCPQDPHLFNATIRDNLRLARPDATGEELEAAAARARLLPWITSLPLRLGHPGRHQRGAVSGGERQRLALARAFLADPALLILDEPTAHLDPPARRALTADLLHATEGRAVLLITHELDGLDQVDQIVVLDHGQGRRTGQPPQLRHAGGHYQRMWENDYEPRLLSRVVIVGGGFAGLFAARALRRAPVQVTLIDRAEHHLFQPLLYQCATGILSEGKIASPLRELLKRHRNVEFVLAEVTGIDAGRRRVLARRPLGEQIEFGYDYLILAAGVRQSYFGHDEYARFAPGMKTIEDAMKIRRRVFGAFEMAESADDPDERRRWLTFALVGAGPTGGGTGRADPRGRNQDAVQEYRHIKPEDARVLLFDGGRRPAGDRSARNCPPWPPGTCPSWVSSCTWARSSPKRT